MGIKSFDGYVTKEEWKNIIRVNQEEIQEAVKIACWYAGTHRMDDITTVNVVIYEDGEVRILYRYNSENASFHILKEDYFEDHKAFLCVHRIRKYYPLEDVDSFEYSSELKRIISSIIEKENYAEIVNKKLNEMYTGKYKNYEELNGNQLAYVTRECEELYNSVNDFLAYKSASDFSKLNYLPYDNGIRFLVESCSPGISHNKFLFRDGINDEIVEEYNRFVKERNL